MKGGNAVEAELEFKQMALAYPQLSAPYINLGILYRKGGHLDQSEEALKNATQRNDSNAVAWTELGATQRLRGEFPAAAASYEKAIAADPNFAPAYRNLGVVSDLYLGDSERALTAFERYKELTGEDRPVTSWIAELRQRLGKPAVKPPAAPAQSAAPGAPDAPGSPGAPSSASPSTPSQGQGAPTGKAPAASAPGTAAPPQTGMRSGPVSDGFQARTVARDRWAARYAWVAQESRLWPAGDEVISAEIALAISANRKA
jgi:tetratricopeptide (TPR) repeat protein